MPTEFTNRKKLSVFLPRLLFIIALTILSSIVNAQTQRAIDGELATCKVTWDDKVFQSKLNQIGCFDLPPAFPSDAVVFIEINYPNANIGDRVILSVQDGGQLDNGKDVKVQKIDNNKNLIFSFHLYDEGLHRVILRKGNDSKTVQLWGKNNVSITAEDTTHESGNPDKNPGDSCKPCKSKTGSNPFNSYNGNVHREIKDLEIWGGAGEIPLVWMRYGNSRTRAIKANYGQAHEWSSSFQYTMTDAGTNKLGQEKIKIDYPEQGHNIFTQDKMNPALWLTDSGVDKRLFQEGNNFFLQTGNGFRYRFEKLFDLNGSNYYQLQDFRDSYQNLYTLSYIKKHLSRITEPAGRYLEIVYKNLKGQTVIDSVKSSDGRSVIYHYSIIKDSLTDWVALDTVYYGDGTKAIYTYSQKGPGSPLRLEHAIDPRNEATDVDMKYIYDTQRDIAGFIKEERNGRTGEAMATLTVDHYTRTVCYPNGRVQTLVFPDSLMGDLHSYTDGLGGKTKLSYQNGTGFAKTSTDELGRTTIYNNTTIYGNFLKITHPDGSIERWTRDDLDLILTHTDELGRITTYTRDNNHRVKRIDYADGSYETLTYNKFGEVLEYKRRNGAKEYSFYDTTGLRRSFRDAEGNLTRYSYDNADRLASVTDALGHTIRYEYNERGLLTKITNADGSSKMYTYDTFGNRTTTTDELGHTWTTLYDEFKRPVTVTDPLNRKTKYSYDLPGGICGCTHDNNKPTKIILPSGKITKITYDVEWQKISETVGAATLEAATTFYEYDLAGNLVSVIDPRLKEWKMEYDKRNRKIASIDPLKHRIEWTYDFVGNVVKITRPDLSSTENFYDAMNRDTMTIDSKEQVTRMQYDDEDNMTALIDPSSHEYQFKYDRLNRKTKMIYPDASFEAYTYDAVSNLKTYTNRGGAIRKYNYDSRNREIFSFWNDGFTPSISRNYDVAGKLTDMSNSVSSLSYQYDEANELTRETQAIQGYKFGVIKYKYNLDGLRSEMIYPNGTVLHYHYTKRDQLASIAEDTTQVVAYTYDFNGNRINKILENGTNTNYTYDDANRMLSVDNLKGSASFARFDYGYDKVNRRTYVQRDNDKGDIYKYDAIDQVTDVLYNVTDPAGNASNPLRTVNYDWDSAGNRKTVTDNAVVTNYTTNKLNEYTKINDDKLSYNAKGDLKIFNGWSYKYDAQDRLINATNGNTIVDFIYDARNRCVKRTINGKSIFFYYDNWNLIEERNTNRQEIAHYVNGANIDEILKRVATGEADYYDHDALGSVTQLTNAAGNIVEKYTYDVFGKPTITNANNDTIASSAFGNRFMFTGREYIAQLRLYDYRNRKYNGELGRFSEPDLLRFEARDYNIYRYTGNNPSNVTDPMGTSTAGDVCRAGCAVAETACEIGCALCSKIKGKLKILCILLCNQGEKLCDKACAWLD